MSNQGDPERPARRLPGGNYLIVAVLGLVSIIVATVIVAMVASILSSSGSRSGRPKPAEHPAVGQRLSQLELQPLSGTDQSVALGDLAGKVVLVNFWGTWCPPCRDEAPHLAELGKRFAGEPDFRVLAVSCGASFPEDIDLLRKETEAFLEQLNIDMPTYVDPDWITRGAFASLGGQAVFPMTFVLGRQTVIRGVWVGYGPGDVEQIERLILRLLREGR